MDVIAPETFINGIPSGDTLRCRNTKGLIQKIIQKETEQTEGKAAVIQIIPFVPGLGPRQDNRNRVP